MVYVPRFRRITFFRMDSIVSVKMDEVSERFDELREKLDAMHPHLRGVSAQGGGSGARPDGLLLWGIDA